MEAVWQWGVFLRERSKHIRQKETLAVIEVTGGTNSGSLTPTSTLGSPDLQVRIQLRKRKTLNIQPLRSPEDNQGPAGKTIWRDARTDGPDSFGIPQQHTDKKSFFTSGELMTRMRQENRPLKP